MKSSAHQHEMYENFCNGGRKNTINCDNSDCVEDPEATNVWLADYMQMFNIPELHLLLGIGQRLYDGIIKSMWDEKIQIQDALPKKKQDKEIYLPWRSIRRKRNEEDPKEATDLGFPKNNSAYVALKKFGDVVDSCFGNNIVGDFKNSIYEFEQAFLQTGFPCSTKVHVVCRHLIPFIINYLPIGIGLGTVLEQAAESANSRFAQL